eukprot:1185551-Prorocentrum_minimum.AAC.4
MTKGSGDSRCPQGKQNRKLTPNCSQPTRPNQSAIIQHRRLQCAPTVTNRPTFTDSGEQSKTSQSRPRPRDAFPHKRAHSLEGVLQFAPLCTLHTNSFGCQITASLSQSPVHLGSCSRESWVAEHELDIHGSPAAVDGSVIAGVDSADRRLLLGRDKAYTPRAIPLQSVLLTSTDLTPFFVSTEPDAQCNQG